MNKDEVYRRLRSHQRGNQQSFYFKVFKDIDFTIGGEIKKLEKIHFNNCTFDTCNFENISFAMSFFKNVSFWGCNLRNCDFNFCEIKTGIDLSNSDIHDCSFWETSLALLNGQPKQQLIRIEYKGEELTAIDDVIQIGHDKHDLATWERIAREEKRYLPFIESVKLFLNTINHESDI